MRSHIAFRNRAHEVTRLEAFSDVVFGFAITLLVVSLEVPKNYPGMIQLLRGLPPFAICFFMFIAIWYQHHNFFERYALLDRKVHVLNTFLLFVVLFYVYPLKFIWFMPFTSAKPMTNEQGATLITIYSLGLAAVFVLFTLMYHHAYAERESLQLNEVERIDTLESVWDNAVMAGFGIVSAVLANSLPANDIALAGYWYFLLFIPKTAIPTVMRRRRRLAEERMTKGGGADALPA